MAGIFPVERPDSSTGCDQEEQAAEHGKISSSITDHVPESLIRAKQLWNFGRGNGRRDYDQERNSRESGPQAQQHEYPADNLESADEVGGEIRMQKSNFREPNHAHIRIDVFENSLRGEN